MRQAMNGGDFGFTMTTLTKRVLLALVGLYVVQLVAEQWLHLPLTEWLGWHDLRSGFMPWQPVTAYLLNGPTPLGAFLQWLFLFFLLPPVELLVGRKALLRALLVVFVVATVLGLALNALGAVSAPTPFIGIDPLLTALLVIFGLTRPNARILLFFVLPIKASWVAWGSGLLALLSLLSSRDLRAAMWFGGWVGGYIWLHGGPGRLVRRWRLKAKHKRIEKRLKRFEVIEGEGRGGSNTGGWWNQGGDGTVH